MVQQMSLKNKPGLMCFEANHRYTKFIFIMLAIDTGWGRVNSIMERSQ